LELSLPLLVWAGFAATLIAEWLEWMARAAGWTRHSSARVMGCLVVSRRDARRTWLMGVVLNMLVGAVVIPLAYGVVFETTGRADAINGLIIGLLHGVVVGAALPLIARAGRCTGALAAPGLFGWRFGRLTPFTLLFVRMVYGAVLGYVYVVPPGG
jgi:hypothetical protein